MSRRRRFSGELKAKIVLEALRGARTLQEIASKHRVHPTQVSAWKRQAIDGVGDVFWIERLWRSLSTSPSICANSPTASRPGASSANGSASTTLRGRTRRSAGGRRPRHTAATRLWIGWTSRYAPCPHPHRRNTNGKELGSKGFWRHERQPEYTLTEPPDEVLDHEVVHQRVVRLTVEDSCDAVLQAVRIDDDWPGRGLLSTEEVPSQKSWRDT